MDDHLILYYRINLKLLKEEGKKFKWIKPPKCPACKSIHIWGHGFVLRFIQEYPSGLWFKRYRCNDCCRVFTLRPKDYSLGQYYSSYNIIASIRRKLKCNRWLKSIPRQNQQYWFKSIEYMALYHNISLKAIRTRICNGNITFITKRERYYEITSIVDPPYLSLAVKSSEMFITLH